MNQVASTMLQRVNRLQEWLENNAEQVDCPVWNYFAPGLYARQMLIRAGCTLVGATHKTEHLCIVSGVLEVTTDHGVKLIAGQQQIFVSKPGDKRAGHALTDTYFTTVHRSDETDIEALIIELSDATLEQLIGGKENKQLMNSLKEIK